MSWTSIAWDLAHLGCGVAPRIGRDQLDLGGIGRKAGCEVGDVVLRPARDGAVVDVEPDGARAVIARQLAGRAIHEALGRGNDRGRSRQQCGQQPDGRRPTVLS